jgi:hypothetical protein
LFFKFCCWVRRAWMRDVRYSRTWVRISMPLLLLALIPFRTNAVYLDEAIRLIAA